MTVPKSVYIQERSISARKEEKRLKQYLKLPKVLIFLWSSGYLQSSIFCFYLYLVCTALFDQKNPEYGYCPFNKKDLAGVLRLSTDTIHNWLVDLQNKKLISIEENQRIKISQYTELFKDQSEIKNTQENIEMTLHSFFPQLLMPAEMLQKSTEKLQSVKRSDELNKAEGNTDDKSHFTDEEQPNLLVVSVIEEKKDEFIMPF